MCSDDEESVIDDYECDDYDDVDEEEPDDGSIAFGFCEENCSCAGCLNC
jgi:hypothetical protein